MNKERLASGAIRNCAWCPRLEWPRLEIGEQYSYGICLRHTIEQLHKAQSKKENNNLVYTSIGRR